MKRTTKTVRMTSVITEINAMLRLEDIHVTQVQKSVLCTLAEKLLCDTGNYQGYSCLKPLSGYSEGLTGEALCDIYDKYRTTQYSRKYHCRGLVGVSNISQYDIKGSW